MNPTVVFRYFDHLGTILSELDLQDTPYAIWNCDKKGFQFEHSPTTVCARKGVKSQPGRIYNSRKSVSTLTCANVAGQRMPPLIIVKCKTRRSLDSFKTSDAPPGTIWSYQKKAWMTDILGDQWFQEVFLKHCGFHRPQLLILDSHSSHEVVSLLKMAKTNSKGHS